MSAYKELLLQDSDLIIYKTKIKSRGFKEGTEDIEPFEVFQDKNGKYYKNQGGKWCASDHWDHFTFHHPNTAYVYPEVQEYDEVPPKQYGDHYTLEDVEEGFYFNIYRKGWDGDDELNPIYQDDKEQRYIYKFKDGKWYKGSSWFDEVSSIVIEEIVEKGLTMIEFSHYVNSTPIFTDKKKNEFMWGAGWGVDGNKPWVNVLDHTEEYQQIDFKTLTYPNNQRIEVLPTEEWIAGSTVLFRTVEDGKYHYKPNEALDGDIRVWKLELATGGTISYIKSSGAWYECDLRDTRIFYHKGFERFRVVVDGMNSLIDEDEEDDTSVIDDDDEDDGF